MFRALYNTVKALFLGGAAILALAVIINFLMIAGSAAFIKSPAKVKAATVAIVPGAGVYGNTASPILHDRLATALLLYRKGVVKKLLVSGDHGKKYYDEVNVMRKWLLAEGVPQSDIFLDHAGFSTYETIYRADYIFCVRDAIIVTQRFHLPRAMTIAFARGIRVQGVAADLRRYESINYLVRRERLARIKDFFYAFVFKPEPTFLGEKIPVTGESAVSWDTFK